ncbi:hypothetical protein [Synechococcus sp. PCC 7336]|uniref:hypothetical protein n=1 Tax=Synechococcus sp. PCC 7336 TaxID=195250 RepID=UPI00034BEFFD|nr:hypothetical protein [Synechococcus sp. PCC 7336]
MATYGELLEALPNFRNSVFQLSPAPTESAQRAFISALSVRGLNETEANPIENIHATGIGLGASGGPNEKSLVLKVFTFLPSQENILSAGFEGLPVETEVLPIQMAQVGPPPAGNKLQRARVRPIVGGVSISPLNVNFVGTLGCFVASPQNPSEIFILSNNHVIADTNRLPLGTSIVQPGPETAPTQPTDIFASLSQFIPIQFPSTGGTSNPINEFDAAFARVSGSQPIAVGSMFGGLQYDPSQIASPVPGMRVAKVGRTSGRTHGSIINTDIDGVRVNYGTQMQPVIATFNNVIRIMGNGGTNFSERGDSGSVILKEETGHPVALLFAGAGNSTSACDIGKLSRTTGLFPV